MLRPAGWVAPATGAAVVLSSWPSHPSHYYNNQAPLFPQVSFLPTLRRQPAMVCWRDWHGVGAELVSPGPAVPCPLPIVLVLPRYYGTGPLVMVPSASSLTETSDGAGRFTATQARPFRLFVSCCLDAP